ncbi:hypothetical protein QYE76_036353 [Lolium multiflorum]|uniref:non-specific serine/threonine protein kinase n=1 Tax=Lolium multiflorum TaxID=4521 RepID=A0AAD8VPW1_LOLMU|nr:hypothetical protein QYE76_036353 [Lolium multiflorum]
MEPPGGGVAEVRLYRRRSHGAELLASLELVAPPRLLEADPDPPVADDVDGDLGRCAGFYLALVQDGRVVDVARLLHYSGEPADPEDLEEDYWETGSNTSPDERPRRAPVVFPYRLSSSEDDQSSGDDGSSSEDDQSSGDDGSSSSSSRSSKEDPGKRSKVDGDLSSSSEEWPDNSSSSSQEHPGNSSSRSQEYPGNSSSRSQEYPGNSSSSSQEYPGNSSSSSQEYLDEDIWDRRSYKQDDDRLDDGKVDGDDREAGDGDGDGDAGDDDGHMNLRLWPAKKHVRIKMFSGKKWITANVYRLTWTNKEELEELFKSSFKMDIGAPIPASTVFRNRDCVMDFQLHMIDASIFTELVSELRASVGDFKFCLKLGGENECRVFKCLYQGRKFALKTIRLNECCNTEPREVDIISSLKDKHVMAFYQAWVEPWIYKNRPIADYLFIQLELCKSTLKTKLLPENIKSIPDRCYLFEEIVKGVKAIHEEFIVHRDLKPDNIFFRADMQVCIGDFGDACIGRDQFGGYGGTPNLGTEYYSAPELAIAKKITEKADIYTMGVMLIEIATIYDTESEIRRLLGRLRKRGLPDEWASDLVGDCDGTRGLVEGMIASEPADRPSAVEILEYIQRNFTCDKLQKKL